MCGSFICSTLLHKNKEDIRKRRAMDKGLSMITLYFIQERVFETLCEMRTEKWEGVILDNAKANMFGRVMRPDKEHWGEERIVL